MFFIFIQISKLRVKWLLKQASKLVIPRHNMCNMSRICGMVKKT